MRSNNGVHAVLAKSEHERNSNEILGLKFGFSCSSSHSFEDDSRTGRGESALLNQKRTWNQRSEGGGEGGVV